MFYLLFVYNIKGKRVRFYKLIYNGFIVSVYQRSYAVSNDFRNVVLPAPGNINLVFAQCRAFGTICLPDQIMVHISHILHVRLDGTVTYNAGKIVCVCS